ncbi:MAG: CAAD domain-containing protein, partial [Microcoleaceae cyanobacterium]
EEESATTVKPAEPEAKATPAISVAESEEPKPEVKQELAVPEAEPVAAVESSEPEAKEELVTSVAKSEEPEPEVKQESTEPEVEPVAVKPAEPEVEEESAATVEPAEPEIKAAPAIPVAKSEEPEPEVKQEPVAPEAEPAVAVKTAEPEVEEESAATVEPAEPEIKAALVRPKSEEPTPSIKPVEPEVPKVASPIVFKPVANQPQSKPVAAEVKFTPAKVSEPVVKSEPNVDRKPSTPAWVPSTSSANVRMEQSMSTESPEKEMESAKNKVVSYISDLPENFGKFLNDYQRPLITIGLLLAFLVTVRVLIGLVDVLNGIPLVKPVFQTIGLGYSGWFIYRYLLRSETRQELSQRWESFRKDIVGDKTL